MTKGKVFSGGAIAYTPFRTSKVLSRSILYDGYIELYGPPGTPFKLTLTTKHGREEARATARFILDAVADAQRSEKKYEEAKVKAEAKIKAQVARDKATVRKPKKKETPVPSATAKKPKKKSQPWND